MIEAQNKTRILSVVNIFETDKADGDYANISLYHDGKPDANGDETLQITYGRSQTTEQTHLRELIEAYIANGGQFADDFSPYVERIGVTSLAKDEDFIKLLKKAGREDDIMRTSQDDLFDKYYYQPAMKFFTENGFTLPLSMLVIYDSYIHSGKIRKDIRDMFKPSPPANGGDEKTWISAYVKARREWLTTRSNKILHGTVYRMDCFLRLIDADDWNLSKPVNAHDGTLSRGIDRTVDPIALFERQYNELVAKLAPKKRKKKSV